MPAEILSSVGQEENRGERPRRAEVDGAEVDDAEVGRRRKLTSAGS
jgi:hypothetical protein